MRIFAVMKCSTCPRGCSANRIDSMGFCGASNIPEVATICIHKGEEPPICGKKGITNVFFAYCNLQCIYCQNHEISGLKDSHSGTIVRFRGVDQIVEGISQVLPQTENIVGFVTPSHYAGHIPAIVEGLHARGLFPTIVYNTGGYDTVASLQALAPYVDIYLPDIKYSDAEIASRYSYAPDYPAISLKALREMYNQKGSALPTDENDLAFRGIIIRHLVLPGQVQNSLKVLESIADISTNLHVALMAQYFPPRPNLPDELNRTLTAEEYQQVTNHFYALGLHRGWVQELSATECYRPDFSQKESFEKNAHPTE